MFLSRGVNRIVYQTLMARPEFTAVVGDRLQRGHRFRQGTTFPAALFYMEQSAYDAGGADVPTLAEHIQGETMRFVVRVDDVGSSDQRIAPAAIAQLDALAGQSFTGPDGELVVFVALGEVPITSYYEGETEFQRLGTVYSVTVDTGD
jgi:hypothetical protein